MQFQTQAQPILLFHVIPFTKEECSVIHHTCECHSGRRPCVSCIAKAHKEFVPLIKKALANKRQSDEHKYRYLHEILYLHLTPMGQVLMWDVPAVRTSVLMKMEQFRKDMAEGTVVYKMEEIKKSIMEGKDDCKNSRLYHSFVMLRYFINDNIQIVKNAIRSPAHKCELPSSMKPCVKRNTRSRHVPEEYRNKAVWVMEPETGKYVLYWNLFCSKCRDQHKQ